MAERSELRIQHSGFSMNNEQGILNDEVIVQNQGFVCCLLFVVCRLSERRLMINC